MHYYWIILIAITLSVAIGVMIWLIHKYKKQQYLTTLRESVPLVIEQPAVDVEKERAYTEACDRAAALDPEDAMLYTATLYKRGVHGLFRPDPETSHTLCRALILHGAQRDIRTDAMTLLYEDSPHESTASSSPFPSELAGTVLHRFKTEPKPTRVEPIQPKPIQPKLQPKPKPKIPDDPQNSHQHTVVATSRSALSKLPHVNDTDIISTVEQYIQSDTDPMMTDETKAKALHTLDSLNTIESAQFDGMTERQALARVWDTLEPHQRDTVIHQLADSIEHGMPVCHTGKMTRLASTVDTVLPSWQVKELLLSEASRIRDDVITSATATEERQYQENDNSPLKERMVDQFKEAAAAFVDKHGMSTHVMQPIVDDTIEYGF
jgi:hypothetical protein